MAEPDAGSNVLMLKSGHFFRNCGADHRSIRQVFRPNIQLLAVHFRAVVNGNGDTVDADLVEHRVIWKSSRKIAVHPVRIGAQTFNFLPLAHPRTIAAPAFVWKEIAERTRFRPHGFATGEQVDFAIAAEESDDYKPSLPLDGSRCEKIPLLFDAQRGRDRLEWSNEDLRKPRSQRTESGNREENQHDAVDDSPLLQCGSIFIVSLTTTNPPPERTGNEW